MPVTLQPLRFKYLIDSDLFTHTKSVLAVNWFLQLATKQVNSSSMFYI